jgi:hypothetical protein
MIFLRQDRQKHSANLSFMLKAAFISHIGMKEMWISITKCQFEIV